jgi:hypothetical protein
MAQAADKKNRRRKIVSAILVLLVVFIVAASGSTHRIRTEIEIDKSAEAVWVAFSDFESYPDWNPFIRRIEGDMAVGSKLEVMLQQPGGDAMGFTPTVTELEPGGRFAWLGMLGLPRVFDGAHYFEVEDLGGGRSRFVQGEEFRGLLVPFLKNMLDGQTVDGFERMNQALKARVESGD